MKLKVLSYNVHKLFNATGTKYSLEHLKELFLKLDLDIVFLQEMRGLQPKNHKDKFDSDPLEHLADEIWDYFVYGKNAVYPKGSHGNAILSKYPFKSWKNLDISNHPFEKRGLLLGEVDINGVALQLACTHMDLSHIGRYRQINKIDKALKLKQKNHNPLIFAGDFNDWTGMVEKKLLSRGLNNVISNGDKGKTFPSFFPVLSVDKIFYLNLKCEKYSVLKDLSWKKLSDHLPVYAELRIESD